MKQEFYIVTMDDIVNGTENRMHNVCIDEKSLILLLEKLKQWNVGVYDIVHCTRDERYESNRSQLDDYWYSK